MSYRTAIKLVWLANKYNAMVHFDLLQRLIYITTHLHYNVYVEKSGDSLKKNLIKRESSAAETTFVRFTQKQKKKRKSS